MRSVDDHVAAVLGLGEPLGGEPVDLSRALGLVLACDLPALVPVPPFDNSAMDGFAVRSVDVAAPPVTLRVTGDIPAGCREPHAIGAGEAARIMTGAPLPEGADAIVPVEDTDIAPGPVPLPPRVQVRAPARPGRHIRRRGEDLAQGEVALTAGTVLTPAAVAAAASVGYGEVAAIRRPRVAVIATGAELRPPGQPLGHGQIPDSNSLLLSGLVRQFGAEAHTATTSDDPEEFRAVLDEAAAGADLILTTGGVSVGAFEVVRQATGARCEFVTVAMQPGKPQGIGDYAGVPLLAFPGNPVSVFVSAWLFARPLIARLAGGTAEDGWRPVRAGREWGCPAGREQYLPAVVCGDEVVPAHRLGSSSHAIGSLHRANALARVGARVTGVCVGDEVEVMMV